MWWDTYIPKASGHFSKIYLHLIPGPLWIKLVGLKGSYFKGKQQKIISLIGLPMTEFTISE